MIERTCRSCPVPHAIYLQATPEYDAPRRETARDFWLAFLTWGMVIFAYVSVGYWVATHV